MKYRLVIFVVVAAAAVAVFSTFHRSNPSSSSHSAVHDTLPSTVASYLGVYEIGPPHTYKPVAGFTNVIGRQPNLVGYYSGWNEHFWSSFAQTVSGHGAVTIVQWDPTDVNVASIARGKYDAYLTSFADSVRDFGGPVVIGFGHEMNATWYSWGYGHARPRMFVAAWRHIVTLFRAQGASNVTWLWTINADLPSTGPLTSWWPGAAYVTWVGIDGYFYRSGDTFASVFGKTIVQVRAITNKPVLLSETAVGPQASRAAKIANLFAGMRLYQTLGLVWFDIAQSDGVYHQDWSLEDSPAAEAAFRRSASTLKLAHF